MASLPEAGPDAPSDAGPCGAGLVTLASSQDNPMALAVDGTSVYWSNLGPSSPGMGAILKVPRCGGTPVTLASRQADPVGIAIDATSVYWTNDDGNGSSIAVNSTSFYYTAFGGFRGLYSMPLTGGKRMMLGFLTGGWITLRYLGGLLDQRPAHGTIPLVGGTPTTLANMTADKKLGINVFSIAVDATSVYWTTCSPNQVLKVPLGGGKTTTLISSTVDDTQTEGFAGIAVDETSVYWAHLGTSAGNGTVLRMALDGGAPVTLASGQQSPTATSRWSAPWIAEDLNPRSSGPIVHHLEDPPISLTSLQTDVWRDVCFLMRTCEKRRFG